MDMQNFSLRNAARCSSPKGFDHEIDNWSESDWMTALTGEVGEAANVIKKMNRIRDGVQNKESLAELREQLADEIGDAFIYLDLLATRCGFDLATVVKTKWNKTSEKLGYPGHI